MKSFRLSKNNKGFTLIELIIAMTIFVIVISLILTLFMMGIRAQRKVIAIQNVQDNARYLLGFIAKEIRMSTINSVTTTTLDIIRPDGESVSYFFDDSEAEIERTDSSTSGPINSGQVSVTGSFSGLGIGTGDVQQARVTITINVETSGIKVEEKAEIDIQTTLNPRNLDI